MSHINHALTLPLIKQQLLLKQTGESAQFFLQLYDVFLLTYSLPNINWRDVQTKNVVNNVDMSCLRAPWQNGPYKN